MPSGFDDTVSIDKESKTIFQTQGFWKKQIESMLQDENRVRWLKVGQDTEKAYNRQLKGNAKESKDLINMLSSLGRVDISQTFYNDPIPTVEATKQEHRELEPIFKKLLNNIARHNEFVHQQTATLFALYGVSCIKIIPEMETMGFITIRPEDIIFDEHWIKYGGEPYDRAVVIGERIWKRLPELRGVGYNKKVVEELIELKKGGRTDTPIEMIEIELFELNVRIDNQWWVATCCRDASDLLQWAPHPINRPSYAFLLLPGSLGMNAGILSEIVDLDKKVNETYKKAMHNAASRGHALFYDEMRTEESIIQKAKDGVALVGVKVGEGKSIKDVVFEGKWGEMDTADAGAVNHGREMAQWQVGSSAQKLSTEDKTVTATETNYVAWQQNNRSVPWSRLVDSYLDHAMKTVAIWVKYMFDVGNYDIFACLDPDEFELLVDWMPTLSEDLQEFEIGVEPGSSSQMRNTEVVKQIQLIMQMLPILEQYLFEEGKKINKSSLVTRLLRALDAIGNPEELIVDIEPQEMEPGMEEMLMQEQGGMPGAEGMGMEMPPQQEGVGEPDIAALLEGLQ